MLSNNKYYYLSITITNLNNKIDYSEYIKWNGNVPKNNTFLWNIAKYEGNIDFSNNKPCCCLPNNGLSLIVINAVLKPIWEIEELTYYFTQQLKIIKIILNDIESAALACRQNKCNDNAFSSSNLFNNDYDYDKSI